VTYVKVGRWGKNLAVRLPVDVAHSAGLSEGEQVDVGLSDGVIVIRRAVPRFALAELFAGRSPEEWRADYAGAYDWGPDVGREVVEE
jgi:antitoxin MazE